jgi:hypothetical protein
LAGQESKLMKKLENSNLNIFLVMVNEPEEQDFLVSFDCWLAKKIWKLEKITCKRQPAQESTEILIFSKTALGDRSPP